jgi:hypothetical protein
MRLPKTVLSLSAILRVSLAIAFLVPLTVAFAAAQQPIRTSTSKLSPTSDLQSDLFFPLTPGTWWLYRGTVTWSDQQTEKEARADVTLKMTVEKVIQKPEFTIAVLAGFPRDLDWATGEVPAMPWLLIETKRHEVFLNSLPPDFDYAKLEKDAATLDKLLAEDNLLFRWPLKKGMKFGDAESLKREDGEYCWVVADEQRKSLDDIKGLAYLLSGDVFLLRYATNPDDTEIELLPGVGILTYRYHHHGTVAKTSLILVEFHPAQTISITSGAKP